MATVNFAAAALSGAKVMGSSAKACSSRKARVEVICQRRHSGIWRTRSEFLLSASLPTYESLSTLFHTSFSSWKILRHELLGPLAMALPVVRTALECSDFSQTVWPYFSQLSALPQIYFESITNPAALRQIYLDTNPLITSLAFSLFLAPIFLLVSEINRNYSQVDRVWSILPTIYNAHYVIYAHLMGMETKRLDILLAASVFWSVSYRLSYARSHANAT